MQIGKADQDRYASLPTKNSAIVISSLPFGTVTNLSWLKALTRRDYYGFVATITAACFGDRVEEVKRVSPWIVDFNAADRAEQRRWLGSGCHE
jgi:hypothetical protein